MTTWPTTSLPNDGILTVRAIPP